MKRPVEPWVVVDSKSRDVESLSDWNAIGPWNDYHNDHKTDMQKSPPRKKSCENYPEMSFTGFPAGMILLLLHICAQEMQLMERKLPNDRDSKRCPCLAATEALTRKKVTFIRSHADNGKTLVSDLRRFQKVSEGVNQ